MSPSDPSHPGDEQLETRAVLDDALDTLASILRTLGRHSFPVGDPNDEIFEQQCEAWARHLLTGSPAERSGEEDEQQCSSPSTTAEREWARLREFIRTRRRCESSYVEQLATELRDTILVLVEGLRDVESVQNATSLSVHQHLTRLEKSESPAELREFARKTVVALRQAIGDQHERLLSQLDAVGERLRKVADDLYGAPHPNELDTVTQLYTQPAFEQALRQHVDLSSLMSLQLTLIICQVDNIATEGRCEDPHLSDSEYRILSDCVARAFYRKRDILGRLSENQFSAAILDVPENELEQMLGALLQRFQSADVTGSTPSATLRYTIAAVTLTPSETYTSLLHRAQQALENKIGGSHMVKIV
jgi:GGDEF domain-containing protein